MPARGQSMSPDSARAKAKASTRAAVLAAARKLFEAVGYEAATVRGIAAAAGLSTGAVFASFEDKAALYGAVYGHPPVSPEQGRAYMLELSAIRAGSAA